VFKLCSGCGQEYQSWVSVCPECNLSLDLPAGAPLVADERAAPAIEDPVLLRLDGTWALHALAEALQEQGISSRIDTHAQGGVRLAIYVSRAHAAAAHAIAEELVAQTLPDLETIAAVDHGPSACPACGAPTPESAAACSECGLEFPEVDAGSEPGVR
jgi:predicted amidophosphoribosyltransferase